MPDAFFLPTDAPDRFVATELTEGPWVPGFQHAGPPSALLTRAIERVAPSLAASAQLTRLTVEILGPVPVAELTVRAELVRPGRSVELVEAELSAAGRPVLRARAWRVRRTLVDLPADALPVEQSPPPRAAEPTPVTDPSWNKGYLSTVEWRFVTGHFERPGPAVVWARPRVPLVAGEESDPMLSLMLLADSGNGLSQVLDPNKWWFINTELTVHLHRQPAGEWFCLRAATTLGEHGAGLAETVLYDGTGAVGRAAQALLVGPRE